MAPTTLLLCIVGLAVANAQVGGVGGRSTLDKNSNAARETAWKGAQKITELHAAENGNRHFLPVGIASATQQVVSGIRLRADLIVASSNCGMDQNIAGDFRRIYDCGLATSDASYLRCDVDIWTQSWIPKEEITVENCRPSNAQEALSV